MVKQTLDPQKRQLIIDTTIRLVAANGVSVATAKIARTAGVANGSLFNYFENKQALYESVFLSLCAARSHSLTKAFTEDTPLDALLLDLWMAEFAWHNNHPLESKALEIFQHAQILSSETLREFNQPWQKMSPLLQTGLARQGINSIPTELLSRLCAGAVKEVLQFCTERGYSDSQARLTAMQSFNIYWSGLLAQTTPNETAHALTHS